MIYGGYFWNIYARLWGGHYVLEEVGTEWRLRVILMCDVIAGGLLGENLEHTNITHHEPPCLPPFHRELLLHAS